MGTVTAIGGLVALGGIVAGGFFFRDGIKKAFASPEQKTADANQTDATTDLIKGAGEFGKKFTDVIFPTEKSGSGKQLATDEQLTKLGFDQGALVVIDNSTGIIQANTSPKFTLTEKEKAAIRGLDNVNKLSTGKRKRFSN